MTGELSAPARIGVFVLVLATVFGLALAVGSRVGAVGAAPVHPSEGAHVAHGGAGADSSSAGVSAAQHTELLGGLMAAQAGYTLSLEQPRTTAGAGRPVTFVITGPDGSPVTRYERDHGTDLHFIAVRRDFSGFQHVHPTLDAGGTWRTELDLSPGQWRTFADFTPAGGDPLTLGTDLAVPGTFIPSEPRAERRTATVGAYTVRLSGDLVAGEHSPLTLRVARGRSPITDLQPYLGAYGHLVALRGGDLAYLHVHPEGEPGNGRTAGGPRIAFTAEVPSDGTYHLYLDFKHDGVVHTARFRLEARR